MRMAGGEQCARLSMAPKIIIKGHFGKVKASSHSSYGRIPTLQVIFM